MKTSLSAEGADKEQNTHGEESEEGEGRPEESRSEEEALSRSHQRRSIRSAAG
jgi:hypothetical protein